jgi:hypothetical protein
VISAHPFALAIVAFTLTLVVAFGVSVTVAPPLTDNPLTVGADVATITWLGRLAAKMDCATKKLATRKAAEIVKMGTAIFFISSPILYTMPYATVD